MRTIVFLFLLIDLNCSYGQESIFPQFNLNILTPFSPEGNIEEIPKKWGKGIDISIRGAQKVKLFTIYGQDTYRFPVLVQYEGKKILDFFTRPPSYLLHDFFHQSLIDKHGKQKEYFLTNGTASYIWVKDKINIYYQSTCTITCFPIFYSEVGKNVKNVPGYKSLGKLLEESEAI
ncbi:MAG: hypothetical protein CME61_01170 [Halobacteriovoraceae bacterium]|nr:hypothetical protein [Halobacteriovoraceae bacterium]